ncbi:metallophosphoesterase [Oceanicella sp. SM1341]|uniref:metallophosphoesterase family protein n=1 Tax=Oceanicella sp. SM1341 TaxID=1548889 RepID=UPI00130055ED|nr:metallophosphoesterase [Oceanicella sp. SM1341]
MTRFLHLTDLHFSASPADDPDLRSDTPATLEAVLDSLEGLEPAPDFVLVTGDLTNHGEAESYAGLRRRLKRLPAPVIAVPGNHDARSAFRSAFLREAPSEAPCLSETVLAGAHVIGLDTSWHGHVGGRLEPEQLEFLDAALDRHPDLPKLIAMHHGPSLSDAPEAEWESLTRADTARLGQVIGNRAVAGIFTGHIHLDRLALWLGIPVVTTTGLHCTHDPRPGPDLVALTGASVALCALSPELAVTWMQLPSDRREIGRIPRAMIAGHDAEA